MIFILEVEMRVYLAKYVIEVITTENNVKKIAYLKGINPSISIIFTTPSMAEALLFPDEKQVLDEIEMLEYCIPDSCCRRFRFIKL